MILAWLTTILELTRSWQFSIREEKKICRVDFFFFSVHWPECFVFKSLLRNMKKKQSSVLMNLLFHCFDSRTFRHTQPSSAPQWSTQAPFITNCPLVSTSSTPLSAHPALVLAPVSTTLSTRVALVTLWQTCLAYDVSTTWHPPALEHLIGSSKDLLSLCQAT